LLLQPSISNDDITLVLLAAAATDAKALINALEAVDGSLIVLSSSRASLCQRISAVRISFSPSSPASFTPNGQVLYFAVGFPPHASPAIHQLSQRDNRQYVKCNWSNPSVCEDMLSLLHFKIALSLSSAVFNVGFRNSHVTQKNAK
jgi:hypothetical protein